MPPTILRDALYLGESGYPGQRTSLLDLDHFPVTACSAEEQVWLKGEWFRTPAGSWRRDVCVAGHYLRLVLRPSPKGNGWNVGVLALRSRTGDSYGKLWVSVVREALNAPLAALAFFRLFQPGPAE